MEYDSCGAEGPAESLLHTSRMQQSVIEGAMQFSNISMHGVGDTVQQRCYFGQSCSVSHHLHWIQGASLNRACFPNFPPSYPPTLCSPTLTRALPVLSQWVKDKPVSSIKYHLVVFCYGHFRDELLLHY